MKLKYILFFIMSLFLISNTYATLSVLVNNTEAYYDYENNLLDITPNGNDGTGTSISYTTGIIGQSVDFNGVSSRVDFDNTLITSLNGADSISYSFWIYPDTVSGIQFIHHVNNNQFNIRLDNNILKLETRSQVSDSTQTRTGTFSFSANNWYHIVVIMDVANDNLKAYVNGVLDINSGVSYGASTLNWGTGVIRLGQRTGDFYYNGLVDELAIFNISLDAQDVTDLYNSGTPTSSQQYPFSFGAITTNITDFYDSLNVSIQINSSQNTSLNYSLNGASNVSLGTAEQFNFSVTGVEGVNNITFYYEGGNLTENFTIDTTLPNITILNTSEIDSYIVDWTTRFNFSDDNIDTCEVLINGRDNTSNCDTNFTFYYNGNNTILINVTDLAGNYNTANYTQFVNPTFYIYFNDNTEDLQNFSVNGTLYEEYFTGQIYDYGLTNNTFLFQKGGYDEFIFDLNFTNTFDNLNQTLFTFPVFFTIQLIDISNGLDAPNNNYTLFVRDTDTDEIEVYNINDSNNIVFQNNYEIDKEIEIRVILNTTLSNTIELITARENVTIPIYLNFETTSSRIIEVLKPTLTVIPDSQVYLYKYIPGDGFVLETIKTTNVLGQVFFNIVENTAIYNICNTYEGATKCLSQVSFENVETDPYQIVHDSTSVPVQEVESMYINWNYLEEKNITQNTSKITFNLVDSQLLVESFCVNVTRYNGSLNNLGEYCIIGSSGQVVQTFNLFNDQYIIYDFYYTLDSEIIPLTSFTSYGEKALFEELKNNSILLLISLMLCFLLISVGLITNNVTLYNIIFLGGLIILFSIFVFFNLDIFGASLWTLLTLKTIVLYLVKRSN